MPLDLDRMLAKCRAGQWSVSDLSFEGEPTAMSREREIAVCQYYADMAGIEGLAAALFAEQRRRADDPRLEAIFATFVADEHRHATVARRLVAYFDRHQYREYECHESLTAFQPWFEKTVARVSPEVANSYILSGEILLDVALLRALGDYVDDPVARAAMHRIDQDEARHIAVDFYMVGLYASDEGARYRDAHAHTLPEQLERLHIFARMLHTAGPFLRDVFFEPMDRTDPHGVRMREAFKRIQLVGRRHDVSRRPFPRFLRALQQTFNHPIAGALLGPMVARVMGLDPRVIVELYTAVEERRAQSMSLHEMAEEVLSLRDVVPTVFGTV